MIFEAAKPLPIEEARIREFAPSGRLEVAGFEWFEVRPSVYSLYNSLLTGGFVALVIVGVVTAVLLYNKAITPAALAVGLVASIGIALWLLTKLNRSGFPGGCFV